MTNSGLRITFFPISHSKTVSAKRPSPTPETNFAVLEFFFFLNKT